MSMRWIWLWLYCAISIGCCQESSADEDPSCGGPLALMPAVFNKTLVGNVFKSKTVAKQGDCDVLCYLDQKCFSYNFISATKECQLCSATMETHPGDLVEMPGHVHREIKSPCKEVTCPGMSTCRYDRVNGVRCVCPKNYKGIGCETDVNECTDGTHNCSTKANCTNLIGSFKCTCKAPEYHGDGVTCLLGPTSCKGVKADNSSATENKAYPLTIDGKIFNAYCHMTTDFTGCGAGPWTMVMKIDGTKRNFGFESSYWKNAIEFNPNGGATGFDNNETKLPTYWGTAFTKICLGFQTLEQRSLAEPITKQL